MKRSREDQNEEKKREEERKRDEKRRYEGAKRAIEMLPDDLRQEYERKQLLLIQKFPEANNLSKMTPAERNSILDALPRDESERLRDEYRRFVRLYLQLEATASNYYRYSRYENPPSKHDDCEAEYLKCVGSSAPPMLGGRSRSSRSSRRSRRRRSRRRSSRRSRRRSSRSSRRSRRSRRRSLRRGKR